MVTQEEKNAQARATAALEGIAKYVELMSDIDGCVNNVSVTQAARIRCANRIQVKADGTKTKNADEVSEKIRTSPEYRKFAEQQLQRYQDTEDAFEKYLESLVVKHRVYSDWLDNVVGIKTSIAGTILSEIHIEKIFYRGQVWKYSGTVGNTKRKKGEKVNYNVKLKSRLLGVLATSFLKAESEYSIYYYTYMCKKLSMYKANTDAEYRKANPLARMNRQACRYMIQRFLSDYYVAWRKIMTQYLRDETGDNTLEFPIISSYPEGVLGLVHVGNTPTKFEDFYIPNNLSKHEKRELKAEFKKRRVDTRRTLDELHQRVDELKVACGFEQSLDDCKAAVIKKYPEFKGMTYVQIREAKEKLGIGRGRKKKDVVEQEAELDFDESILDEED